MISRRERVMTYTLLAIVSILAWTGAITAGRLLAFLVPGITIVMGVIVAGVVGSILSALFYTFPSIALFQLLVPFTGLTYTTTEIPLVSYTLVILFPNITAGLNDVPAEVMEAGRGMGLTRGQLLARVEMKEHSEYRTKRLCLEAFDRLTKEA